MFIHPRCATTIERLQNYRARGLDDGSYLDLPDPSAENHQYSHACDSLRYLAWVLRREFGIRTVGADDA